MTTPQFDPEKDTKIEAQRRLTANQIFEVVRRDGEEELRRPALSLAWSGLAAGLAIGFSVISEAAIMARLPHDLPGASLIADWGYSVGFILVVLGNLQLFTENTITPVMPICYTPTRRNFIALARIWSIVFLANMVGAIVVGLFIMKTAALPDDVKGAVLVIADHAAAGGFLQTVFRGIGAGFIIAALVWLLANVRSGEILVVALLTYVIAICGFAHVVAGAVEMTALVIEGHLSASKAIGGFIMPAFLGNVIGGTLLFTLIAYGQIRHELND